MNRDFNDQTDISQYCEKQEVRIHRLEGSFNTDQHHSPSPPQNLSSTILASAYLSLWPLTIFHFTVPYNIFPFLCFICAQFLMGYPLHHHITKYEGSFPFSGRVSLWIEGSQIKALLSSRIFRIFPNFLHLWLCCCCCCCEACLGAPLLGIPMKS